MSNSPSFIYLDYNATFPSPEGVVSALAEALRLGGNPSSTHGAGRKAKQVLNRSREIIATFLGAHPNQVIFTSGGTEANAMVLMGSQRSPIILTETEHDSVHRVVTEQPGLDHHFVPINNQGIVDLQALEQSLIEAKTPALVSILLANNETGILNPVEEIVSISHKHGSLVHVDAIQALGKIPISFHKLDADFLTVSAHKVGGPQGVGALIAKEELPMVPLYLGGGQEKSRRSGTENVSGIAGFAAALEIIGEWNTKELESKRNVIEDALRSICPDLVIVGRDSPRLSNTCSLTMPGVPNSTQVIAFDLEGIAISSGAACSSGKIKSSRILKAMGFSDQQASEAIRVSLGPDTPMEHVEQFIRTWKKIYHNHHKNVA
ncbi:MAG: cysteine desulfurase [Alphaproteobacteria bacterium]|jgi:cysteine desulfurase|nr:cysteine desulfurase [Alphaproteobacteria bacterium]MBT5390473.1 cysteine desulfurase [Alphaproteobacteria bacterium]MBT5654691.1 cysteine desulfurase [Alphaproteobacteria bacterium]